MTNPLALTSWPPALTGVYARYDLGPVWIPGPDDLTAALDSLHPHAYGEPQPPLRQVMADSPALTWMRLTEVAVGAPRPNLTARLVGALTRLATDPQCRMVINIGSDGAGQTGISVGLPPVEVAGWRSGLATDLLWAPGPPHGWPALAMQNARESALVGTVVPATGESPAEVQRPPSLDLILAVGSSLGPWSIDMVLTPVAFALAELAQDIVLRLLLKSTEAVNKTRSQDESSSSSFADARAERVVQYLQQWQTSAEDCVRVAGWDVAVRVRASAPEDLATMAATFQASLGDDVHVSHPTRRQAWSMSSVSPAATHSPTWLSSRDIADLLLYAGESVGGIQARRALAGGRMTSHSSQPVALGTWLGTSVPAEIDVQDLSAHTFIAGITGSGKSTTTRTLLAQVANSYELPFLVIDPAKTDYAEFGRYLKGDLRVVRASDLRMNVLKEWPGRPADQHVARVSNAFRGSFSMPSPVPYVASILLEELGREANSSEVTLHDAWSRLDSLIEELRYRGEIEDNIRASLGLRLRLLLQPSRADRVASVGVVPTWLTERPTVIQLGDIADEEERNFIASMLVLYVSDAARARGLSSRVQHLTVIEEAHRLMPEPRPTHSEEGDSASVSAKLMAQLLAEIRAYGEALVVIDQSPAAVSREVLRNTNVKLVHRVVDRDDQRVLGGAIGLDEDDSPMLGSLGVGRALVSSRSLVQPQAVAVAGIEETFAHDEPVPVLRLPTEACHNADRSSGHHAAERNGQEMELLVGLWSLGSKADLRAQARALAERDPAAPPACLIRVGIRRYARTLVRINYLAREQSAGFQKQLWESAVQGRPAPDPVRTAQRPYPGCVICPDPCVARGVVASRSLLGYRRGQAALTRTAGIDQSLTAIHDATEAIVEEIGAGPAASIVGICAAVHLAAEQRVSGRFVTEFRRATEPPSESGRT